MPTETKKSTISLHRNGSDCWLTPLNLIKVLGKFDLDPCCEERMPWKTARRMLSVNGLEAKWSGRVWLNPPYSKAAPWAEKFTTHKNGIALFSAKSTDSKWLQNCLTHCDAALWLSGRLLFFYPDGKQSTGKWLSNVLVAFGADNVLSLCKAVDQFPGVLMTRYQDAD